MEKPGIDMISDFETLAILFLILSCLIAPVLHDIWSAVKFNSWLTQVNEIELRKLLQLQGAQSGWIIYTVILEKKVNEMLVPIDEWSIARRWNQQAIKVGYFDLKIALIDNAQFGQSKVSINIGNLQSRWVNHRSLILRRSGQPFLSWKYHKRSLFKSMTEKRYLLYETNENGIKYMINRNLDRYELFADNVLSGVATLGGFEGRIAAIDPKITDSIVISLLYSALTDYPGPRVKKIRVPR